MERSRLINILLILLVLIAALYLGQLVWQLLSGFSEIILLFILGWFASFLLKPIISTLSERPLPVFTRGALADSNGSTPRAAGGALTRIQAVVVVYVLLLVLLTIFIALAVPPTVQQLSLLGESLPEYFNRAPEASAWVQAHLGRFGASINIEESIKSALVSLQTYAASGIQNALGIFSGVVSFIANLFFVLILSFYFAVDETRLRFSLLQIFPKQYHEQLHFFAQSVDRTFGGFMRGQLVMAILQGIGTAIVMMIFHLDFVLIASLFGGLFMIIPLVGGFFSLLPALFVALFESPDVVIWLVIALFVYQFIVTNVLMPRILSASLGMHPLLVFAALLVGVKLAGFWGAFFGIPVVGVIWAMLNFFWEERQRSHAPLEQ